MRQALTSRNVAIMVMVVLILLGLVIGTRVGIKREYNKLIDGLDMSLTDDVVIADTVNIANKFVNEIKSEGVSDTAELENTIKSFKTSNSLADRYSYANDIETRAKRLFNQLKMDNPNKDYSSSQVNSYYSSLSTKIRAITESVNEYNEAAKQLNRRIDTFPCNILRTVTFVKKAEII